MQAEWKLDAEINPKDLTFETLRTPKLHSKYIDMYVSAKKLVTETKIELEVERKEMAKYYRGEFTQEELEARGIEQYLYKRPLKAEMETILKSDDFVVTKYKRVEQAELAVEFLTSVLAQIKQRDWAIRNSIQYTIFINGG